MLDLENHPLFTCQDEVKQLSTTLFDNLDMSYFCFARFFANGSSYGVTTNGDYCAAIINNDTCDSFRFLQSLIDSGQLRHIDGCYFYPIKEYRDDWAIQRAHGIGDIVAVIEPISNGFNLFSIGSTAVKHATETAWQRPDVLIGYKYDFMDKYQRKLLRLESEKITPRGLDPLAENRESNEMVYDPDSFKKSLNIKRYWIVKNGEDVAITAREKEALQHLAHAETLKEIARNMGIEVTTARTYLQNLQEKLGVTTKHELLRFYFNSDLSILDAKYPSL